MNTRTLLLAAALLLMAATALHAQGPAPITYPATRATDQADDYFGFKVPDPYRWLENDTSAETAAWVEAQNKVTNAYLAQIPYRAKLKERLDALYNYPKYSAPFHKGNTYFFYKNDGLQNQSVLYTQQGLDGTPSVLLDPNTFSADGTTRLVSFALSQDGALAAECGGNSAVNSPFLPKKPHFAPRAKRVISLFMSGGVSHVDTFDYKPKLYPLD